MSGIPIDLAYLVASALFILALKGLAHPRTSQRGNWMGAAGMLLAVIATLLDRRIVSVGILLAGILVGSAAGAPLALKVPMTAMPQMVGLLNGLGGGASVLVAVAALADLAAADMFPSIPLALAAVASAFIGTVTFWGSLVAFGKLQGLLSEKSIRFPGQRALPVALAAVALVPAAGFVTDPSHLPKLLLLVAVSSVLGVLVLLPVGGADMPVMIALLNSFSGLAAAATGFVLFNNVLIIAGSLVGASGLILTQIMCRAMNRSLGSVLMGISATGPAAGKAEEIYTGRVKSTSPEEVALLLDSARRVVVVPGYGLAVAQAQYAVADLSELLEKRGIEIEFAIHPVAGRMPGHMNVLLAEANIPYEKLKDLDEINPTFSETDVVLVIGANDVVNPLARTDQESPIAGMPILDVDRARTVVIVKRSLNPGFAGIPNPLFAAPNGVMLFGDGKEKVLAIIEALKEL